MGTVFKERFPEAEVITAEFVNYADEYLSLGERLSAAAAAAAASEASKAGSPEPAGNNATEEGAEGADKEVGSTKKAVDVGTVVFNAVFGNLWDQGAALERAAAILEVRVACSA